MHLLWWFLDGAVLLEGGHLALDAAETVGQVAVLEAVDLVMDPVEETRHQRLIVLLHLLDLQQAANHLTHQGGQFTSVHTLITISSRPIT